MATPAEHLARLAFVEQVAGAPPTHRVRALRDNQVVYEGPEASARWVLEACYVEFCWGVDLIGPVALEALSDGAHHNDGGSESPGSGATA